MTDTDYNVIDIQEILEEKYKADETNIKVTYSKNSILMNLIYIKLYLLVMSRLTYEKNIGTQENGNQKWDGLTYIRHGGPKYKSWWFSEKSAS